MKTLHALIERNIKLFFKDKGLFFSALITPLILLVLYATFLGNTYRSSFLSALPEGFTVSDDLINGLVGGQLISSLLAVCCVTVAFCSNMLMVQDKVSGARRDLTVTPVRRSVLALGYYIATAVSTLIIFSDYGMCWIFVSCQSRLVSLRNRYFTDFCRCFPACTVRHGTFQYYQRISDDAGANIRSRHNRQRRIRLSLRRLYADFQFQRRLTESAFLFARNLRHFTFAQSRHARCICRNGRKRFSKRGHRGNSGQFRLQSVFLRQCGGNKYHVLHSRRCGSCGHCRLYPDLQMEAHLREQEYCGCQNIQPCGNISADRIQTAYS